MSGTTISTSDTKIEALKFQSSSYGGAIPVVYGVTRIPANLLWYNGFKATPNTSTVTAGGKGGDVTTQTTTYTYSAAVAIGLCEGQITGIGSIWRGKNQYAGGPSASQIITASDAYLVPGGGGSRTVPVSTGTFSANISVVSPSGGGEISQDPMTLAEGTDYTRVGGVYTFLGNWAGTTLTINYQYLTASVVQTSLQQLGLSLASGALGQAVWSYLTTNYPAQAIGYSGTAFAYGSAYALGDNATVQNHSFEVQAKMAYTISTTVPDADPALAMYDLLTSAQYGANFPSTRIYNVTNWSNYCRAAGLLLSPALTEQMSAADAVVQMCKLTNTGPVWSEGVLKFIPYGDTPLTANGATYTPNTTAIYDLDDRHFLDLDVPVKLTRKAPADAFNQIQVEFWNRSNQYNTDIAEAKDQANIDTYGARPAAVFEAHWCADPVVARNIAQIALQRALYVRNTYQFKLSKLFSLLEPMDIVTLTDTALALSLLPVRITNIEEGEDEFTLTAEDFTIGVATTTLYPSQSGAGFSHNYNAAPGPATAVVAFEAPGALTTNGLEVWVAASSSNTNWGGAHLWISLDGSNYLRAGTINGGSRNGSFTGAVGASGTVPVAITAGVINSGSAADAAAFNTLCYAGGSNKEYFSHQGATLTSALHYDLTGCIRGIYGSTAATHSNGEPFVRVDDAIGKSGPIDLGYIGKTIHLKLTSFNVYGGAEESLASVTDYTYTLTGWQVYGNAGAAALLGVTNASSDNIWTAGEKPSIILDVTTINNDLAGLDAQANVYQITTEKTNYDNAVAALNSYLATLTTPVAWNNLSGDTTIVGTTARSNFASVYSTKQVLVNKITDLAYQKLATRPNMVVNGGFEYGLIGWTLFGLSLSIYDSVWGRSVVNFAGQNGTSYIQSDAFPVQATVPYTISADILNLFATSGICYVDMQFYSDAAGTVLVLDGTQNAQSNSHDFAADDTNRKVVAVQETAPASAVSARARVVWGAIVGSSAVGVRQVMVQRGGLPATPYQQFALIAAGGVQTVDTTPGLATGVASTTVTGPVTITAASFTPDGFSVNTQMASVALPSGPAPELGATAITVLVTVSAQANVSSASGQTLAASIQNNASYDGFQRKDVLRLATGNTSGSGNVSLSARFTVTANAAVTFGLWANNLLGTGTNTMSNIEMRVEVIKR